MSEQLYKVLNADLSACHGGTATWTPSEWMPDIVGDLVPGNRGYHILRRPDVLTWIGPTLWLAEYDGERIDCDDKIVVRRARITEQVTTWNERSARLFACDCAERVLPIYERAKPNDNRPREAIAVARRFAVGDATAEELAAAWAAAWAAAGAAASYAASAAASYAASAAASYAARAAASYAARAAEIAWHQTRLWEHIDGTAKDVTK